MDGFAFGTGRPAHKVSTIDGCFSGHFTAGVKFLTSARIIYTKNLHQNPRACGITKTLLLSLTSVVSHQKCQLVSYSSISQGWRKEKPVRICGRAFGRNMSIPKDRMVMV